MRDRALFRRRSSEDERQFEAALRPTRSPISPASPRSRKTSRSPSRRRKRRGEAMDHVLLYGPPGLGKTTLAGIIAAELGVGFQQTSGPVLQKKLDLVGILSNIQEREVFFIDEIHRLLPDVEEMIYSALEDFRMDILIGTGPGARTVAMELKHFTAIGATTRQGLISAPLRGRFGLVLRLNHYDSAELTQIVPRSARLLDVASRRARRGGNRAAQPGDAAHRQPAAAARARLRPGARRGHIDAGCRADGARPARSGSLRAGRNRSEDHADRAREIRRRPGGDQHDRGVRSTKSRTPSKKSTSRT